MAIGSSIFLIAIGAILKFAVDWQTDGIDLGVVGIILMIVGFVGVLASLVWADSFGRRGPRDADVVVRERDYVA